MRTKALLLTAAFSVAGVAAAMAQVYSANTVGYVNRSLSAGYSLIANPLNGTNNHLNTILPLPDTADGTTMFRFKPNIQNYGDSISYFAGFGWFSTESTPNFLVLAPGEGVFIRPGGPTPLNVTFVGDVWEGVLSNPVRGNNNNSILASQVPQALPLGSAGQAGTLMFPALDGDTVYLFNVATQAFKNSYTYVNNFGWFSVNADDPGPNGPIIPVATSFLVRKKGVDIGQAWTRNFGPNLVALDMSTGTDIGTGPSNVTPATDRPALVSAIGSTNLNYIDLAFNKPINLTTGQNPANYVVNLVSGGGTLTVSSAVVTNGTNVVLNTSPRSSFSNYKITITGVSDTAQPPNLINPNPTVALVTARVVLTAQNHYWRYDERDVDNGTAWRAVAYNDSAWSQGPGLFGLDSDAAGRGHVINTPLQLIYSNRVTMATNPTQTTTYYFRTHFGVTEDGATSEIQLRSLYDDGLIVYLNGGEVWRSANMTNNPINHTNFVSIDHEGSLLGYETFNIGNTNLVAGDNVLAVEVHQNSLTSSDVLFGLVTEALVQNQVPQVRLHIRLVPAGIIPNAAVEVSWSSAPGYVLVESATVTGTYTPVPGNPSSPFVTTPNGVRGPFFRLRKP